MFSNFSLLWVITYFKFYYLLFIVLTLPSYESHIFNVCSKSDFNFSFYRLKDLRFSLAVYNYFSIIIILLNVSFYLLFAFSSSLFIESTSIDCRSRSSCDFFLIEWLTSNIFEFSLQFSNSCFHLVFAILKI